MDLGFNLAQSNRDLKDPTSRQNFGDTSGLLCKNDLIPCHINIQIDTKIIIVLNVCFLSELYIWFITSQVMHYQILLEGGKMCWTSFSPD